MRKMGIRRTGLLVHSAIITDALYKLNKVLAGLEWMVTGAVANQLWVYLLAGNCVFCRPTDNIDITGVNIIKPIEDNYGVMAEGFEGDLVRRLSFLVSHDPKLKVNVESYSSATLVDELERRTSIPFRSQSIPIISMEDLIVYKLAVGRKIDIIDITSLLRAYKRYLRASIINNESTPKYIIRFSKIIDLAKRSYSDNADEILNLIKEISNSTVQNLAISENNPRKLINLINL